MVALIPSVTEGGGGGANSLAHLKRAKENEETEAI